MTFNTTTIRRTLSLAAAGAALASAGLAGSASAATIGPAEVLEPGATIPIDIPGYREPADNRIQANHRLVRVPVEIARGERVSTVLTAPKGFRAVTIASGSSSEVGGVVSDRHYRGKRSVRVNLFVNRRLVGEGESGQGTLYLFARRAGNWSHTS